MVHPSAKAHREFRVVRSSTFVMLGIAAVFGLLAVFVARTWLDSQSNMRAQPTTPVPQIALRTVVVAAQPLRFGTELTDKHLREVSWPEQATPPGSFATVKDALAAGRRIVLAAFETNEPLIAAKITGPGQRATLSAVIREGMRAVTVRVDDVEGVAGFVLPGDHVDVVLTRQPDKANAIADVVLQNVRVLAVDQLADDATNKPTVAKAVTLEVDTLSAQKVTLAASVGNLSLALRRAGERVADETQRVSLADLGRGDAKAPETRRLATIAVIRASKREEYNVPIEGTGYATASQAARKPR